MCAKAHPFSSCLAFDDETGSVKRNSLDIVFDCDFEYGFLAAVPLLESIDFVLTIEIGGYVVSQVVINRVAIVFEISPSIRAISRDDIPTVFSHDIFHTLPFSGSYLSGFPIGIMLSGWSVRQIL